MMLWLPLLLALISPVSQQMFLNDSRLCRYFERVFAEAPNEFESFRGKETENKGVFGGTFKFAPAADCKLTLRRETDDGAFPPEYVCTLGEPLYVFDEARTIYDLTKEGMRACLSGFVFEEKRRGGENGYAFWYFRGYKPGGAGGARVTLRLNDLAARIAESAGKTIQEIMGPTVVIEMSVEAIN